MSGSGVVSKVPSVLAERDDERAGLVPDAEFANRVAGGCARCADLDLGELEVGPGGGRDGVEERRHLRLQHEIRHHLPGRRVRQDDAVGAREHELSLGVVSLARATIARSGRADRAERTT